MTPTVDGFKVLSLELSVHPSIPYINVVLERRKQRDGADVWAICELGHCFNHQGEWEYEPIPSERTPEFFERCRWPSMEAAIAFWRANGKSRLV